MTHTVAACPHCEKPLKACGSWEECKTCYVSFVYEGSRGLHIKWERIIGEWFIALNLYPETDETVLLAYHTKGLNSDDPLDDSGYSEVRLDHCMTNITPQNCLDKIKLLLVWQ